MRSKDPGIHDAEMNILESVPVIMSWETENRRSQWVIPRKQVMKLLIGLSLKFPLKDRVTIANMNRSELPVLYSTFVTQIREQYGFVTGNEELMESCRIVSGNESFDMSKGPALIIDLMWVRLKRTHTIRTAK